MTCLEPMEHETSEDKTAISTYHVPMNRSRSMSIWGSSALGGNTTTLKAMVCIFRTVCVIDFDSFTTRYMYSL